MKRKLLIIFNLMLVGIVLTAQAQPGKFISVKDKDITWPNGKPFLMRGTNLGNWLIPEGYMFKFSKINSPKLINEAFTEIMGPDETKAFWHKYQDTYITRADIHYMHQTGMNTLRIPFSYRLFTSEDYLDDNNPNRGFELLDRVIEWCRLEGIYVILDMHAAPGGQTGDNIDDGYGYPFLFQSQASRALTVKIWTNIAARYKNNPAILGYDLLNEPIAHYFNKEELNPYLEPFFKELTKAVRMVDKNHIVIFGGAQWDSNMHMFGKPFDNKAVYTFHKYWTKTTGPEVIQEYLDYRNKYNVPIYCGETGENNDEWVAAFRKTLEENNIGWTYWPYKKMDNTAGIITFARPAGYDTVINYTEKPRMSFEEIRKAAPANRAAIKKTLYDFIENSRFENCTPNTGYIEALGLTAKK